MVDNSLIIDFFNKKADLWNASCACYSAKQLVITELCGIKKGDRVLDIACGTGIMTPYLLKTEAAIITGIDIAEKMIEYAQKKYIDNRLKFLCGDIYDFDEPGWDVVIIYNAYPHLTARNKLIKKLSHLLVSGGRFVIAHNESGRKINTIHNPLSNKIYKQLKPVKNEAYHFKKAFTIDTLIDTRDFYVISGVLK